jgi:hypothetical protein
MAAIVWGGAPIQEEQLGDKKIALAVKQALSSISLPTTYLVKTLFRQNHYA